MRNKVFWLIIICISISSSLSGATAIFTCPVGGATLEYLDDETNTWHVDTFPKTLLVPRYTYVVVKVTAPGYENFEQGYEIDKDGVNNIVINLELEDSDPTKLPLFGIGGQIISKRGLDILPDTYQVIVRNMTTYKKTDGPQVSQDINPNGGNGGYSGVFANLVTNRAAAVGDRVFVGAFNSSKTRCYGYNVKILTEDDLSNGGVFITILVR